MKLRCSVCYFLLKPLDLDEDAEIIVKGGFSFCDDHAHLGGSMVGYHQAIAEENRAATDDQPKDGGDE